MLGILAQYDENLLGAQHFEFTLAVYWNFLYFPRFLFKQMCLFTIPRSYLGHTPEALQVAVVILELQHFLLGEYSHTSHMLHVWPYALIKVQKIHPALQAFTSVLL